MIVTKCRQNRDPAAFHKKELFAFPTLMSNAREIQPFPCRLAQQPGTKENALHPPYTSPAQRDSERGFR
ncbi:hypothetical protein TNCT_393491 [Trichonephila clavata]|uniref:Uncharacterized protein n=1 Tax=Trichonephila clavata TaxID=2740835 RepID=A0A8X6IR17_TRICU|nr:hypothetical protein TNCT_393491 [Trichonephila clavata]